MGTLNKGGSSSSPGRKPNNLRLAPASLLPYSTTDSQNQSGPLTGFLLNDDGTPSSNPQSIRFNNINGMTSAKHITNKNYNTQIRNRNQDDHKAFRGSMCQSLLNSVISPDSETGQTTFNDGPLTALMFSDSYNKKRQFGRLNKSRPENFPINITNPRISAKAEYLRQNTDRIKIMTSSCQDLREKGKNEQNTLARPFQNKEANGVEIDQNERILRTGVGKSELLAINRPGYDNSLLGKEERISEAPDTESRAANLISGAVFGKFTIPNSKLSTVQTHPQCHPDQYKLDNSSSADSSSAPKKYRFVSYYPHGSTFGKGSSVLAQYGPGNPSGGSTNPMLNFSSSFQSVNPSPQSGNSNTFNQLYLDTTTPLFVNSTNDSHGIQFPQNGINSFHFVNSGMSNSTQLSNNYPRNNNDSEKDNQSLSSHSIDDMGQSSVPTEFMDLQISGLPISTATMGFPYSAAAHWLPGFNGIPIIFNELLHKDNLETLKMFPSDPEPALRTFELQTPESYIWDIRLTPLVTFMQALSLHSGDFNEIASDARTLQCFIRMVCESKEYQQIRKHIEELGILKCIQVATSTFGHREFLHMTKKVEKLATQDIPAHAYFSKGRFTCPYRGCPLSVLPTFTSVQIRQHIMRSHPRKENCALCRKEFSRSDALKRHVTTVHKPDKRDLIYSRRKRWLKFLISHGFMCPNELFSHVFRHCFYISLLTLSERRKKVKLSDTNIDEYNNDEETNDESDLNEDEERENDGENENDQLNRAKRTRRARPSLESLIKKRKPYTRRVKSETSQPSEQSVDNYKTYEISNLNNTESLETTDYKKFQESHKNIAAFKREEELSNQAFVIKRTTGADAKAINRFLCPVNPLFLKINRSKILSIERRKISKQ